MMAQTYSMKTAVAVFIKTPYVLMMSQAYVLKMPRGIFIGNMKSAMRFSEGKRV